MTQYERKVRKLVKTINEFFEMKGMNAAELQKQLDWINAYHLKLDRERYDEAEKLQKKLF